MDGQAPHTPIWIRATRYRDETIASPPGSRPRRRGGAGGCGKRSHRERRHGGGAAQRLHRRHIGRSPPHDERARWDVPRARRLRAPHLRAARLRPGDGRRAGDRAAAARRASPRDCLARPDAGARRAADGGGIVQCDPVPRPAAPSARLVAGAAPCRPRARDRAARGGRQGRADLPPRLRRRPWHRRRDQRRRDPGEPGVARPRAGLRRPALPHPGDRRAPRCAEGAVRRAGWRPGDGRGGALHHPRSARGGGRCSSAPGASGRAGPRR